jgi:ferredoxin
VSAHLAVVANVHQLAVEAVTEEAGDEERAIAQRAQQACPLEARGLQRAHVQQRERHVVEAGLG